MFGYIRICYERTAKRIWQKEFGEHVIVLLTDPGKNLAKDLLLAWLSSSLRFLLCNIDLLHGRTYIYIYIGMAQWKGWNDTMVVRDRTVLYQRRNHPQDWRDSLSCRTLFVAPNVRKGRWHRARMPLVRAYERRSYHAKKPSPSPNDT